MWLRGIAGLVLAGVASGADLQGLDELVERTMRQWQVPGLALAVVRDGEVVHSKGYGMRDRDRKLPVTPRTMFGIGSITKSVTVLALSSLADEGKLDWDRPVRDYAPDFRLHDPVASERATLRDLVSHRTGLPRHDGMWFTGLDRNGIFARLRYLEPSRDFRAQYQYNNVMYMAAGVVGERIAGRSWETLVRERVFAPTGMATANFSVADAEKTGDWAHNYTLEKDAIKEIPPTRAVEAICPAGCINANLEEMTAYLKFHLAGGARVEKMREAQIAVPAGGFGPDRLGPGTYGMGVVAMRYRGRLLVFHTGTIGGYHALLAYLPEERAGVMIMQNRVARNVPQLLSWWIWDRVLGLADSGWFDKFAADEKSQQEKTAAARAEIEKKRRPGTSPSHAASEFAGLYTHPAYGDVRVEADGEGKLTLHYGGRARPLTHWHYDVFSTGDQRYRFVSDTNGAIRDLAVRLEPAVDEIVFRRPI